MYFLYVKNIYQRKLVTMTTNIFSNYESAYTSIDDKIKSLSASTATLKSENDSYTKGLESVTSFSNAGTDPLDSVNKEYTSNITTQIKDIATTVAANESEINNKISTYLSSKQEMEDRINEYDVKRTEYSNMVDEHNRVLTTLKDSRKSYHYTFMYIWLFILVIVCYSVVISVTDDGNASFHYLAQIILITFVAFLTFYLINNLSKYLSS